MPEGSRRPETRTNTLRTIRCALRWCAVHSPDANRNAPNGFRPKATSFWPPQSNSLNGRKLPILIHSGGGIINQAMLMGYLIRARGLDVAVARTAFDPCANASGGCKQGTSSGPLGEPESQTALCNTSCTFVLAGGVRRFVGQEALVGVQNFRLTPAVVEKWRQTYRGTTPVDTVIQRSFVPPMGAYYRTYFRKLGISEDIVDLMVSMGETPILTETKLLKLRLATEVKDGRAVVYGNKGDSDRAIADHNKAIEIDPKYAPAYLNRGIAHEKKGDHDRAIADFDKVIEIDPKYAPDYNSRGIAYEKKGEYDRAIADYGNAIELDPKYAPAYNNRGTAYRKKGDSDRAIADYGKAIEIDPKYAPVAYLNRGAAYEKKGDHDLAIADYSKVIEIDPKYAGAYFGRGNVHEKKGDHDQAIADYSKAIEIDPKEAPAYNGRAMVYFTAGKPAQGLPDVEKSLELHPDDPDALETRGLIFEALGRKQEAVADFRRALETAPNLQSSKDALKRLGALGTP
jgi:tetratricopeptide (TPR) repeat protein